MCAQASFQFCVERRRLLAGKEAIAREIEALLFRHDPIGINFGGNADEYRPEAETIALRPPEARSVEDVRRITHEEFVKWFGHDTAGDQPRYASVARDIWAIWSRSAYSPKLD